MYLPIGRLQYYTLDQVLLRFWLFLPSILLAMSPMAAQPLAQEGWLDLRAHMEEAHTIPLDGEWEFYWQQLLSPEDVFPTPTAVVNFPVPWTYQTDSQGNSYPSEGYATYRCRLLLKPGQDWALMTPAQYNSFRVFVNGHLVSENGKVGTTKATSQAYWLSNTVDLEQAWLQDTTEIVVQISNFRHQRGGPVDQLVLGDRKVLQQRQNLVTGLDIFLTGALVMGGLFFLGLFWFGRHQRTVLYFALFCLAFSYYKIASGNYVLHALFPSYPYGLMVRLEYGSIYVNVALLFLFTRALYPKDTPGWLGKVVLPLSALYFVLNLVLPTTLFPGVHGYYLLILIGAMMVIIGIYFRAARKNRTGSRYTFFSTFILLAVILMRMINFFIPFPMPIFVMPLGIMLFFFLHSLTLSQQFARAWKESRDQAEAALKARSEFLSVMSHEIRTPMNAVIGLTHHMIADNPPERFQEVLGQLKFSGENLLVLINDILDFSKLEAQKVEFEDQAVYLKQLMDNLLQTYEPLANEKQISLILDYDPEIPDRVVCDPTRLAQVLTNLIGNAIKFTQEGGVTLRARQISKTDTHTRLEFAVEDTGIGIPKEKLDTIFDSFSQANSSITREFGGTGLGLAISKRILDLQGVNLEVNSEAENGTRFHFILELAKAQPQPKTAVSTTAQDFAPLGGKVLLVEDNAVNVLVARKFLDRWGLEVETAENGKQALEAFAHEGFDLVLMDLQMPIMDGYTATTHLRKSHPKVPIIALTATALPEERQQILDVGMNSYVLKPFKPETLYRALAEHLAR
ncbi:MAG TPA: ATPase [Cytophagales bacterium]|nr:ATPase [Cytophagales bacterium]HAP60735.1 ATPase [Cytophagales bacterium]